MVFDAVVRMDQSLRCRGIAMKVLMITSEWPTEEHPYSGKFVAIQAELLKKQGIDISVFPFRGQRDPLKYFSYWKQIRRILTTENFDLIHAQFGQSGLLALPKKIPMVVTYRGTDLNGYASSEGKEGIRSKILRRISRCVATKADQIIVVSRQLSKQLPKGFDFNIIPSGLDLSAIKPMDQLFARKHLGLPLNKKIVFFPASPQKQIKRFKLAKEVFDRYQKKEEALLVTAGNLPFEDMVYYYNAADVLLFTSLKEGSPNAVKEALACNLPVVSVKVGDVEDRIGNIPGCYLSPSDSVDDIYKGLDQVISQSQNFEGRKYITSLDNDLLTKKVIDIYQNICGKTN